MSMFPPMRDLKNLSTKERFVQEARRSFLDRGYTKSTLRDIASRCNVVASALYKHYGSKEDLVRQIYEPVLQPLLAHFEAKKQELLDEVRNSKDMNVMLKRFSDTSSLADFFLLLEEDREMWVFFFTGLKGTCYENYEDEIARFKAEGTWEVMEEMRKVGLDLTHISRDELYMGTKIQVEAYCKILMSDADLELKRKLYCTFSNVFRLWWFSLFSPKIRTQIMDPNFSASSELFSDKA